eukprot:scaffold184_cov179-Amphora_coffeaeformis.AAC.18
MARQMPFGSKTATNSRQCRPTPPAPENRSSMSSTAGCSQDSLPMRRSRLACDRRCGQGCGYRSRDYRRHTRGKNIGDLFSIYPSHNTARNFCLSGHMSQQSNGRDLMDVFLCLSTIPIIFRT